MTGEHILSVERTGQTIAEWLVEALDELGNRRAEESVLDVACIDDVVVRLTAQIFRPDGPQPPGIGMQRLARAERDCAVLFASLAQAWRAMREGQRLLTSPDPNPIDHVVAEELLDRSIANARQVLDRTSRTTV